MLKDPSDRVLLWLDEPLNEFRASQGRPCICNPPCRRLLTLEARRNTRERQTRLPPTFSGLCGHEGLRYHFEIANLYTGHTLQVGSHCILKFDVAVYEGTRKLSLQDARKKLDRLIEQKRFEACIKALEELTEAETSDILQNALAYYRKNKQLTPRQAFVVFWRLHENRINHEPSFFKIALKKKQHIEYLEKMETSRVHFFWRALTHRQRNRAVRLGHTPPPDQVKLPVIAVRAEPVMTAEAETTRIEW